MTEAQELADLRRRVTDLELRVRKLENPGTPEPPHTDRECAITGTVRQGGELTASDQLRWTITLDAYTGRTLPRDRIAEILTAVSNPARIHILQKLPTGPATSKKLQEPLGYSSSGPSTIISSRSTRPGSWNATRTGETTSPHPGSFPRPF